MLLELQARTPAGATLVALAEQLAPGLAPGAAAHDRAGTFSHEAIAALRSVGYFGAPVPAHLGGLGVVAVHDLVVASSRLARGDASTAIGVNMHLLTVHNVARRWRVAVARDDVRRATAFAASLAAIVRDEVILAAAVSERGQDLTRPRTTAVRTPTGWRVDGEKVFCTMSPAATHLLTAVRFLGTGDQERYGYVEIPAGAAGVHIRGDWDALGMRGSGSHSVAFDGVQLPEAALRGGFPTGAITPYMDRNMAAGLLHAAASLGIAESAHATVGGGRAPLDGHARVLVAENAMDLAAARGILARAASLIDDHDEAHPTGDEDEEATVALFAEAQAAKAVVNAACQRVVDRALALSGGAGYVNGSPLARAYRDVRAGAFMHPLGANRVHDFLARVALGEPAGLG